MKNKVLSVILVLALTAGMFVSLAVNASAEEPQTRTVMLYFIGSNLESSDGQASYNLRQIMNTQNNEYTKFVVMTGGAKKWTMEAEYLEGAEYVDPVINQVWAVEGIKGEEEHGKMTLLEKDGLPGFEACDMADKDMITSFIDYCYDNYPADLYDIILWDHGGGPGYGFGQDERFDKKLLTPKMLVESFQNCKLIKDGKKFEIINFDACIMGNVELTAAFGLYADYYVASPESEPGTGQNFGYWIDALNEDPYMSGYDLCINIVDGMIEYYNELETKATLTAVDMQNFYSRMLPLLTELDSIMIREATVKGELNGKYNFYDEMYSILMSYLYDNGDSPIYDLGDYLGALSAPQTEFDNLDIEDIELLRNAYTDTALQLLEILNDYDNDGDDAIYADWTFCSYIMVEGGFVRFIDGEFIEQDENGYIPAFTTGLSIELCDGNTRRIDDYVNRVKEMTEILPDGEVKDYLRSRIASVSCYTAILLTGKYIGNLSAESGKDYISYDDILEAMKNKTDDKGKKIYDYFMRLYDNLVWSGVFETVDDAEKYMTEVVDQQNKERLTADKISVKKIANAKESENNYKITVSDGSSQVLYGLYSLKSIDIKTDTDDFKEIYRLVFLDNDIDLLFPDGLSFTSFSTTANIDFALYYEDLNDSDAELYKRMFENTTSVWTLETTNNNSPVLIDGEGKPHLVNLNYLNLTHTNAIMPVIIGAGGNFYEGYFYVTAEKDDYTIDGFSFSNDDWADRSYYDMGAEWLDGAVCYPVADFTDSYYNFTGSLPISTSFVIDTSKEMWGLTMSSMPLDELEDVVSYTSKSIARDFYGSELDITDMIGQADQAAEQGDCVYDITDAGFELELPVYNGEEQKPEPLITMDGKTLVKDVDYKVVYDGSSEPGYATLAVFGTGDYIGFFWVDYTILCDDVHPALVHVEAKAPTEDEEGNIEYWYCEICERFFADEDGKEEITYEQTVLQYTEETTGDPQTDIPDNPPTKDDRVIILCAALMIASAAAAAGFARKKSKAN